MTAVQNHPEIDVLVEKDVVTHGVARRALAVLRIGMGVTFLWAFFDKLLALGYSTGTNAETGAVDRFGPDAWLNEGNPTFGFLSSGCPRTTGSTASSPASPVTLDELAVHAGPGGIGFALLFGVGIRIAAASGALLYLMMWRRRSRSRTTRWWMTT